MPGHHIGTDESGAVEKDVIKLFEAIDEHDVVFLLTDTRESRWLPTMYCAYRGKVNYIILKRLQ
jgi:ubiquitin-like modifier-activating enzyme ATG7